MDNTSPLEQVMNTPSVDAARASLVAQQQRLMDLLEERSKPTALDYWSTMAGALAGSGKSGYDALASAGAGSGLAVRQQDEKAITLAKMRADVANAMLGQAERQGLLRSVQGLFGGQGGGGSSVAPSISINAAQQSVFDSLPQRDKQVLLARISSGDPTEIHNVLKELSGEALKRSGPSKQEDFTTTQGTFRMTPYDFSQYQAAQKRGEGDQWLANYRAGTPTRPGVSAPTVTTAPGSAQITPAESTQGTQITRPFSQSISGMRSEEEKKESEARIAARAKEEEQYSATTRSGIFNAAEAAPRLSSLASSNIQILKDNPDAVGVLASPGVGNALLTLLSKARIGGATVGSVADLDMTNVESALIRLGPKRAVGESKEDYEQRRQRTIDASMQITRNLAEMELNFAKSYLKGQGAVSNMERNITRSLGGNISDSRNALLAKSELLIITSEYDEKIRDAYLSWADKNKGKGAENFRGSQEERAIRDEYNKSVNSLNEKFFSQKSSTSRPSPAKSGNEELRNRLRQQLGV
jgi:hypothetical protein